MEIDKTILGSHDFYRAGLLIQKAAELDMDLSGYGVLALNESSGNVYLWVEDYSFTLGIRIFSNIIEACWTDQYTGEEHIIPVENKSLAELELWQQELEKQSEANHA